MPSFSTEHRTESTAPDALAPAVLAELDALPPGTVCDAGVARLVRDWVLSGAPLLRGARADDPPIHLVSYALVLAPGAVLLGRHRKAGRWLPMGGHVEPGEHPRATARRELAEELALDRPDPGPPIHVSWTKTVGSTAAHTDVGLWYVFTADPTLTLAPDPGEFSDLEWFPRDALPDQRDPKLPAALARV